MLLSIIAVPMTTWAQETESKTDATQPANPPESEAPKGVDPATLRPIDKGDNAWMLVSSALVLFMTVPGLAMFYGGLVRKKNVVSVLMQCIFLEAMMTVLWVTIGYSLSFGGSGWWIGDTSLMFLKQVAPYWDEAAKQAVVPTHPNAAYNIPWLTHMLFQGMFFIITPGLICGAFAERMKFSAMVLYSLLWGILIYCPLCHWVWGGGILAFGMDGAKTYSMGGALDFAGGTVVHISSGISALVAALLIGKRAGFPKEPMPPHNLAFTALGAGMLWVGWFGFNAGSAIAADGVAASAFAATHIAAAAAALSWAAVEVFKHGKATLLGASSGAVAGLVCITPAAGHVLPMSALIMGLIAGVVCALACLSLKPKLGYDDSLDAFGVHGIGGTLGAILTGVFATRATWNLANGDPLGLLEGGTVLKGQIVATLITWGFAAVGSFILLKVVDVIVGLRVTPEQEVEGLDVSQHGEEGYIFS